MALVFTWLRLSSQRQLPSPPSGLPPPSPLGPPGMALVFTWLRLSSQRHLPWYKNSNYQSKDIAHVQKVAAQGMADKVCVWGGNC